MGRGTALAYDRERDGRSAGNGAVMRTAPVALAFLDDAEAAASAAWQVAPLTHVGWQAPVTPVEAAVVQAADDPAAVFAEAVVAAVRGGGDTDTVAAVAGALAGAVCGESAIRADWRDAVHVRLASGPPESDAVLWAEDIRRWARRCLSEGRAR
jgi:ADP-ribosylglycohydrolase